MNEVRNLFVSSENRNKTLYPYGNSYTLHITQPIKEISKVELLHCSVPNSLYNVTNGSNVIEISNVSTSVTPRTTFSIPEGFYGGTSLATEITNAVSTAAGITVTYLTNEGKFLFTRPAGVNNFSMNVNSSELVTMLGFSESDFPINSTNVAVETDLNIPLYSDNTRYRNKEFIKSTRVADLNPNEAIFLDIKELRTPFNEDTKAIVGDTYSGQNMSRSFGMIPMDVISGSIKRFKKTSDYDFVIDYPYPIQKLDRVTVEWVNRNGQRLSFNGAENNSFLLRLHTLRNNL